MKVKCNLCDSLDPWDADDPDLEKRKAQHEKKHLRREGLLSERDGHKTNNSTAKGVVEWIEYED